MGGVAQDELQGVPPGWQLQTGLGLSGTKMHVLLVGRNSRLCIERLSNINEQVVVPGIWGGYACGRNSHVAQAEAACERTVQV